MIPMGGGMPSVSTSASSSAKSGDGNFGGTTSQIHEGDWNVSNGNGQGNIGMTSSSLMYLAIAGVAAVCLLKRK